MSRRADDGLGTATDTDPCPQRAVLDRRIDLLVRERRPCLPRPCHWCLLEELHEEIELLLEELVVVREVVAEQRIGLRERPATENDLRAAVRDRVDRREPLK